MPLSQSVPLSKCEPAPKPAPKLSAKGVVLYSDPRQIIQSDTSNVVRLHSIHSPFADPALATESAEYNMSELEDLPGVRTGCFLPGQCVGLHVV